VDESAPLPHAAPASGPVRDVKLATFPSWTEAEMFAQLLRADAIQPVLIPLVPYDGWGSSTWSAHEIRVAAPDLDRAESLLAEYREGPGPIVLPGEG
jgi:hypothetical protein